MLARSYDYNYDTRYWKVIKEEFYKPELETDKFIYEHISYSCDQCSMLFNSSLYLKSHISFVHKVTTYFFNQCTIEFYSKSHLKKDKNVIQIRLGEIYPYILTNIQRERIRIEEENKKNSNREWNWYVRYKLPSPNILYIMYYKCSSINLPMNPWSVNL